MPDQESLQSICFFLVSGRTFVFRDVTVLHDNQSATTFTYTAMSDGLIKTATFFKEHVAGIGKLR